MAARSVTCGGEGVLSDCLAGGPKSSGLMGPVRVAVEPVWDICADV